MVLDAVSNFVRGTADAAVGTDDTTVSVSDASIFPDPATDGEFNVVIWDANNFPRPDQDGDVEILRVTERDTTADELTVTRGQEMTSAATHPEGSAIHLSPTAKMFSDIESTFGDFWDAGTQELAADVNNTNTTTQSLEADGAVIDGYVWVSNFDGATADDRLDNAIATATGGETVILLEPTAYSSDRTISKELVFFGSNVSGAKRSSYIDDGTTWTLDSGCTIERLGVGINSELIINGNNSMIDKIHMNDGLITLGNVTQAHISFIDGFGDSEVVFSPDSLRCIIDTSSNITVTDNGTDNVVGDIS